MSIHPFILLVSATVLLWQNRPLNAASSLPGQGNRAAHFASALIFLLAALLAITALAVPQWAENKDFAHSQQLTEQLALYAALPLLVSNGLAKALGFDWDRTIWGRILLAFCAVFALTRTSVWLDYWMWLVLAGGLITFALPVVKRREWNFIPFVIFWLALCAGYAGLDLRNNPGADGQHWSWLGLLVIPYIICAGHWLSLTSAKS